MVITMIRYGLSRMVILIGSYAIKIPNPFNGDGLFVTGMIGNILERSRWKECNKHPMVAEQLYCFPLGLFAIMRRYDDMGGEITQEEYESMPFLNIDIKRNNFARTTKGIIVLDYGNFDQYYTEKKQ